MYNQRFWDDIYNRNLDDLPWVTSDGPNELLAEFAQKVNGDRTVLDYGGGEGRHARYLRKLNLNIVLTDISIRAIETSLLKDPDIKVMRTDTPGDIKTMLFDGILCWGVIHHIKPIYRKLFYRGISLLLKPDGLALIGSFSKDDSEFETCRRISKITLAESWPIETDFADNINKFKLQIIKEGIFEFNEKPSGKPRIIKYYFVNRKIKLDNNGNNK